MMALSLGLAAGVMTGVSLSELLPEGISVLLIAVPGAGGNLCGGRRRRGRGAVAGIA